MPSSVKGLEETFNELNGILSRTRTSILERLSKVGEKAVAMQRGSHIYKDQTGNLTSSIGYVVLDAGKVYRSSGFSSVQVQPDPLHGITGGDGKAGTKAGKDLIKLVAQKYATDDIALVIVAGMEYAEYVEAKGLNVIDTANMYVLGNATEQVKKTIAKAMKIIEEKLR